jgi:molybdate transport system regulatory protein
VSVTAGEITAAITQESAAELGLAVGSAVTALIKSTDVALAAV